jgi:oxygen-independent coproporphyrinogen III oxidase
MTTPLGLYLHIPFCRQRCDFCAFYLELHRQPAVEAFLQALEIESELQSVREGITGRSFHSVYFGGGTPTVLSPKELITILHGLRRSFVLDPDSEITLEAHPGSVTRTDLIALREASFSRISFGAESMHDHELVGIGRPGAVCETTAAVRAAQAAGFTNINLDLMYGLPEQSLESWKQTLEQVIALAPTHLSCYALTVEEGTRLAHDIRHQRRQPPDEGLQVAMDEAAQTILTGAGYQQYEISNYARPGFECRHNLLHWTQGEYLGLGPSAQSFVRGVRFGNVPNLTAYHAALAEGRMPTQDWSILTEQEQLRDAVIFGLRLVQGIPTQLLRKHAKNYGYTAALEELRDGDLIEEHGDRSRLSAHGRQYADTVAEKLF